MNKKQEEFILYCLVKALSAHAPYYNKHKIENYVYGKYEELGDE